LAGALADREAASIDEHRALELERLDALQTALWDKAINGDAKAANAVLRIIDPTVPVARPGPAAKVSTGHATVIAPGLSRSTRTALVDTRERNRTGSDKA